MRSNKHLVTACYVVAALLVLVPLIDLISTIAPFRPGDARWRFAASGLISRSLLQPALGLLLAFAAAIAADHRAMQRTVSILAFVAVTAVVLVTGLFLLDAVQVRATLTDAGKAGVTLAAASAAARFALFIAGFTMLGLGAWKSIRGRSRTADSQHGIQLLPLSSSSMLGNAQRTTENA